MQLFSCLLGLFRCHMAVGQYLQIFRTCGQVQDPRLSCRPPVTRSRNLPPATAFKASLVEGGVVKNLWLQSCSNSKLLVIQTSRDSMILLAFQDVASESADGGEVETATGSSNSARISEDSDGNPTAPAFFGGSHVDE